MVGPVGIATYDAAALALGLRPLDVRVLGITEAAGRLAMIAALAMAPALPMLVEGIEPMIDPWRATTPVTEL
jgi:hypothetical protein